MRAIWNNQIIAESDQTIYIEGNQYFPPESVNKEFLTKSDTHTTCPWKGVASYFSIVVDGQENTDAAWYYPTPKPRATEIVKQDFSNYVAFWRGVTVEQ
jgi:uncharacterized protein (DUF427 family)